MVIWVISKNYRDMRDLGFSPASGLACCKNDSGDTVDGYELGLEDYEVVTEILTEAGIQFTE